MSGILKTLDRPSSKPVLGRVIRDVGGGSYRVQYGSTVKTIKAATEDTIKAGSSVLISDGKRQYITNVIGVVSRQSQKVVVING